MSGHVVPVKMYVTIFLTLLALTGLTTGVAFIDLGAYNTVVALGDCRDQDAARGAFLHASALRQQPDESGGAGGIFLAGNSDDVYALGLLQPALGGPADRMGSFDFRAAAAVIRIPRRIEFRRLLR